MMFLANRMFPLFFAVIFTVTACTEVEKLSELKKTETIASRGNTDISKELMISPEGCIAPVETFAYSVNPQSGVLTTPKVLPLGSWQPETALIQDEAHHPELLASRYYNGQVELWILTESPKLADNNAYVFTIYYPNSKTWKNIPAEIGDSDIHIHKLFFTEDGSIFGVPYIDRPNENPEISVLSKFNEKTGFFEFDRGAQTIPTEKIKDITFTSLKVLLDEKTTIFWVVVPDDGIYSYNPITQESKRHVIFSDTVDISDNGEVVYSPDGNIYYLSYNPPVFTKSNVWLYRFRISTKSVERLYIQLEPWPVPASIFADHSGRVWFGALGWMEADGTWYQMVRSPLFISNILWTNMEYRWKSPEIIMESSDNRLWFRSESNGTTWLDPEAGKWCRFTTYNTSNIVEDQERNLWAIFNGELYRYPLNP